MTSVCDKAYREAKWTSWIQTFAIRCCDASYTLKDVPKEFTIYLFRVTTLANGKSSLCCFASNSCDWMSKWYSSGLPIRRSLSKHKNQEKEDCATQNTWTIASRRWHKSSAVAQQSSFCPCVVLPKAIISYIGGCLNKTACPRQLTKEGFNLRLFGFRGTESMMVEQRNHWDLTPQSAPWRQNETLGML